MSQSKTPTIVKCPTCQTDVVWGEESPYRPFCSKRCQLIDLGEWAAEEKAIPGAPDLSDSDGWSEEM
ncbi:DNA gyrase inhibitor YacG [Photobacterium galatheae]|uniref:DNA gyrase inhibitor YacG n=1 Tax=Photobacterium galatheae TaxID=1654360 RepID=A0A066RQM4_9GAMM|nr:DNA gyrase inhibitor YacG [Photobacterium galatheae]KDM92730.1 DNA gyrase inhibitor [Photobacterium galatheae]MCM0149353.1 DNA gyrase inhibitor YacG [Photobacterium galatheae]